MRYGASVSAVVFLVACSVNNDGETNGVGGCGIEGGLFPSFSVTVDYSRTVEELIAAGNYVEVAGGINSDSFPVVRTDTAAITLVLATYCQELSTPDVIAAMTLSDLQPAGLWDLLSFGMENPDLEIPDPIAEFSHAWNNQVVVIQDSAAGRTLGLANKVQTWDSNLWFAATPAD